MVNIIVAIRNYEQKDPQGQGTSWPMISFLEYYIILSGVIQILGLLNKVEISSIRYALVGTLSQSLTKILPTHADKQFMKN